MIIEQALLQVKAGQSDQFVAAMRKAKSLISVQSGFQSIEVRPSVDSLDLYLLLVKWDNVESHRDGFRQSPEYKEWRALLHDFYDPMPSVTYFGETIFS
ncbi:antibiotic biosynthesis monooxygenase [Sphingorhabdus sp. Alg231-15]|uniref:antibiotic biosynthesis monooxygenase n=1 Tax=Sphingorhabdus sp. Alg231-15 TaxID=1922222 RepID=UPI000D5566D4